MKRRAGQAGRILGEALHQLGRIFLLLLSLVLLAVCLLGYRLSQGPLAIPDLAGWLATKVSGQGIKVTMNEADLAWAGYRQGGAVPLYLQLGGISIRNEAGVVLVTVPRARLVLEPGALFGAGAPILVRAAGAKFNGSAVPLSAQAAINLGAGFTLARAQLFVTLGPGRLGAGADSVPIAGGHFALAVTPGAVALSGGVLELAPEGESAPMVTLSGEARLHAEWTGTLRLTADTVQAPDLAAYWPPDALPATRAWITRNITGGSAKQAAFALQLAAPKTLASLTVTGLSGRFAGAGLTLHWIPGAAPITALNGEMVFLGLDHAAVTAPSARLGGLMLSNGVLQITGMNAPRQVGQLSLAVDGSLPALIAVLNAPPLSLLSAVPPALAKATGNADGTVTATLPFLANLRFSQVVLEAKGHLTDVAVASPAPALHFTAGDLRLDATGLQLEASGAAQLGGEPARLALREVYQGNLLHVTLASLAGPEILHLLGLEDGNLLMDPPRGAAPFTMTVDGNPAREQNAALVADLTPVALAFPALGWAKAAGVPGQLRVAGILRGAALERVNMLSAVAPGLSVAGQVQGRNLVFSQLDMGGTQAAGVLRAPAAAGGAWSAVFSGKTLSLRQPSAVAKPTVPSPASAGATEASPSGPAWAAQLNFQNLSLNAAPAPQLGGFSFMGNGIGGTLLQAKATAQGVVLTIAALTETRQQLTLQAPDAGFLLQALGVYAGLQGGALNLDASYGGAAPATGTVNLTNFRILHAPAFTKVLQGLTLYGVGEATSGPGLQFDRAVVPFTLGTGVLRLAGARAFSASLGFTASGTIRTADAQANIDATIIPAYALNTLLGRIPLIGRIFSAEKGGGLIAVRAKITGPLTDPQVLVNPLSALTPGVLRDLFGLGGSAGR
jgi:hypothetical protein